MQKEQRDKVFEAIKDQNGEKFARVIRSNNLLKIPNLLHILKYAGKTESDAKAIVGFLRYKYETVKEERLTGISNNPFKLLDLAGYDAFEVKNKRQKNSIKKYFYPGEEICTFKSDDRHKENYIIHAVKKNVDSIKRLDFTTPQRQDEYGTSVISIQIAKDGSQIIITNRYNHVVDEPDKTFDANPDNIIPGLTRALEKYFKVKIHVPQSPVPANFILLGEQLIKYKHERNHVYINDGYYVNNSEIHLINKDYQIQMGRFILDLKSKKVLDITGSNDPFVQAFNDEIKGKKITQTKSGKEVIIKADGVEIARTKSNDLISLHMPNLKYAPNGFLDSNSTLKKFSAPNLVTIDDDFLKMNQVLSELNLPKVRTVGINFLYWNHGLTEFNMPSLEKMGSNCMRDNQILTKLFLPKIQSIRNYCFINTHKITHVMLPEVVNIGDGFMEAGKHIKSFWAPKLETVDIGFLEYNEDLEELILPMLQSIGGDCLYLNKKLAKIYLPKLKYIKDHNVFTSAYPSEVFMPNVNIDVVVKNGIFNKKIIRKMLMNRKFSELDIAFLNEQRVREQLKQRGVHLDLILKTKEIKSAITDLKEKIIKTVKNNHTNSTKHNNVK